MPLSGLKDVSRLLGIAGAGSNGRNRAEGRVDNCFNALSTATTSSALSASMQKFPGIVKGSLDDEFWLLQDNTQASVFST